MTTVKIESSNQSILVWPDEYSESETATVTFYQGVFALLLRVGFLFVQIGCVSTESVNIILMQNVLDIFVTLSSFGLLGFVFAYGKKSCLGVIGYGSWISSKNAPLNEGVRGFAAALTGTAIMTTLVSSRLHYLAQALISLVFSGFVQPILLHSSHIFNGWMSENTLSGVDVSFKDTAMVLVTSVAGSTAGMIGCAFLGRRMLRVRDIDPGSIGPTAPGTTICGYFFIFIGILALALPSPVIEEMQSSIDFDVALIVGALITVSVGALAVIALHSICYETNFTYWVVLKFFQGALASFITVSAAYDLYNIPMCIIVALIGALGFIFASEFLFSTSIEDNCNIISIHFVCGILSCVLPPFFSRKGNLGFLENPNAYMNTMHLIWQFLCCIAAIAIVGVVFAAVFLFLFLFDLLRHESEKSAHERAQRVKREKANTASEEANVDYILPNVDRKEMGDVGRNEEKLEIFTEDGDHKAPKQEFFVNIMNVSKTPFNSEETCEDKTKAEIAANKCDGVAKSKLPIRVRRCKNVVIRNPLYSDSSSLQLR